MRATRRGTARDFSLRPPDFEGMIREGAGLWRGHNAHLHSMGELVEENPAAGGLSLSLLAHPVQRSGRRVVHALLTLV